jgi:hypothetical protein
MNFLSQKDIHVNIRHFEKNLINYQEVLSWRKIYEYLENEVRRIEKRKETQKKGIYRRRNM